LKASRFQRISRRLLSAFVLTVAGAIFSQPGARAQDRSLSFYNIHTKETLSIVYKRGGQFDQDALQKLNYFMRDWRRNITVKMDPALFDLIWEMHRELGSQKPIHVICGHRSGGTNEMLRKTRGGQARGSKHITGQAIDLHFPDVSAKQIRNSALIRERGGVGYYPTSAIPFVHVDTGNVRAWPRVPRQELAILFPSGKTRHIPADGKPLTKGDFRMAMAQLQKSGGELPIAARARLKPEAAPTLLAGLAESRTRLPAAPTPTSVVTAEVQPAQAPVPALATPAAPATAVSSAPAVLATAEPAKKPVMMMASFAPMPKLGIEPAAPKAPSLAQPVTAVAARAEQTSARADIDAFARDILNPGKPSLTAKAEEEQAADEPDYDDDHPDEEAYQPFPILPFMSDIPIASMDLTDAEPDFSLAKVHMLFGEPKEMLDTRFRPGLQYAEMFWAQRFRGTAINTTLRRLARDDTAPTPVRTAQQNAR
jgi:uncharacterized protein YcbK (DUF882 family)